MTEYEKFLEAQKLTKLASQTFPKIEVTPERMEELREKYKTELQALETPEQKEKDFLAAYGSFENYEKYHKKTSSSISKIVQNIINSPKPTPAPQPKPFAGLLIDLSDKQLDKLFEILTNGYKFTTINSGKPKENVVNIKYIDTDINCFKYVFGGKDKPVNFQPIIFLGNKQILRQILTELQKEKKFNKQNPETRELSNEIVRQTPIYFVDDKNKPFELAKNDYRKSNPELIDFILATI